MTLVQYHIDFGKLRCVIDALYPTFRSILIGQDLIPLFLRSLACRDHVPYLGIALHWFGCIARTSTAITSLAVFINQTSPFDCHRFHYRLLNPQFVVEVLSSPFQRVVVVAPNCPATAPMFAQHIPILYL